MSAVRGDLKASTSLSTTTHAPGTGGCDPYGLRGWYVRGAAYPGEPLRLKQTGCRVRQQTEHGVVG